MENTEPTKKCCCPCHAMKGLFVIIIGLAFLLEHLGYLSSNTLNIIWPSAIVLVGIKMILKNMCRCCGKAGCSKT